LTKALFDIFDGHPFDGDHCFLCGSMLTPEIRTAEHVFPRWLQEKYDLKDLTITLLNGTTIPYRSLVIPCCKACNGTHLSQLEARIRAVVSDDSRTLNDLADEDVNAWLSKIYIGILWKELELTFDRRNPDAGPIFPKELMNNFRMVHFFMQACRKPMVFHTAYSKFPNTLLRVDCKADQSYEAFDYLDSTRAHSVAIRMGNKGLIGLFDGGLHEMNFPDFCEQQFGSKPLHPVQFKEIFAKLTYKAMLSQRVPFYGFTHDVGTESHDVFLLAFDDDKLSATLLAIGTDSGPIALSAVLPENALNTPDYGDWSQEEYARVLSTYTGAPFEKIFRPPDLVATTLRDNAGNLVDM
jgi:hypothetical protein